MLLKPKAKNARAKRFLVNRDPKIVENGKTALFVRGSTTSQVILDTLKDLYSLRKPDAINFTKKNEIHPFDSETSIEFFARKNDSSLFAVGMHSKKRPHNLILGRTFNYSILDMIELGVERCTTMQQFKAQTCAIGMKPLMIFNGEAFNQNEDLVRLKSILLDFFRGEAADKVSLKGLEYVITVTAGPAGANGETGLVFLRTYTTTLKKSGTRQPRVELEEMGPSLDLRVRRVRQPTDDMWKQAIKMPRELKVVKTKNISRDGLGDKYGRIHVGKQEINKIQTRKVKALKKHLDDKPGKRQKTSDDMADSD
ncbi:rRNA-binding ribosome biosynthesis protein rpf2 [Coemansia sp. RSA 376]|nr:rRNA-binding ribosome biosynthesis protein rpf2 [Coemansia sp. S3946]KAJ2048096.1 rRNA-binding ribosome biosynthesis protein rpf2 [Coemansia sp. S16]KAJ2055565.1 rRNA-binding ribosome biosynthesis protein rpf2 [Coemansia sp. S2]KAJ2071590.1 rRNA-binding ribosome biosynthesis protein rpf2 [Coemansia sp. S155-1]KAJ2094527.1 rRNA-binding ribosome biosynthesis protein rpf2 [Coemansia sp. S100]KAJ2115305.1 rRNA-binding ribosome biosynthesis protein rpf2 [Coemansia sp. RSA 922]KAJ2245379.1 rRNA-